MVIETDDFKNARDALHRRVFSSVAHELKTPLACIIGALQIIEQMPESLSAEQHAMLIQSALTEAHRIDVLVNEALKETTPE